MVVQQTRTYLVIPELKPCLVSFQRCSFWTLAQEELNIGYLLLDGLDHLPLNV